MNECTRLLIFSGKAGTGKTTAGRKVATALKCCYFDYDTVIAPFLLSLEDRDGIGESRIAFYRKWRSESYATLWAPVLENLKLGNTLVISAPFTREMKDPEFFTALREKMGRKVEIISFQMRPDENLHAKMLMQRHSYRDEDVLRSLEKGEFHDEFTPAVWNADKRYIIGFSDFEAQYDEILRDLGSDR